MPEEIGLKSVFETRDFQAGLQIYLAGLAQATAATQAASQAITGAFAGLGSQISSSLNAATQQITQALGQITQATSSAGAGGRGGAGGPNILQQELEFIRLQQAELADNLRLEESIRVAAAATNSAYQTETQSLLQQEITLKRLLRDIEAARLGFGDLSAARGTPVATRDIKKQFKQDVESVRLQQEELRDTLKLQQAQITLANQFTTALQKANAQLAVQEVIERRIAREREALNKGFDISKITAPRGQDVSAQLGLEQRERVLAFLQLQRNEQHDLIKLEEARLVLATRTSTEFQIQAARLTQQEVALRQAQRTTQARQLGFDPAALQTARGLTVTTADLNRVLSQTTKAAIDANNSFRQLTVGSIALGTAIGQTAVNAIRNFISGLRQVTGEGIELLTFFERFELSANFFEARSLSAKDASISLSDALAQTSEEGKGLLVWLQQIAILSPFTTQDVAQVFRVSQAYGLLAEQAKILIPLLLDMGAATGLDIRTIENAARALGQVNAIGRLTGEEIRQLGNAGIPIRELLTTALHITNEEFNKLLESGSLTADVVIPAITKELKKFEGAGKRVAVETIGGLLSVLQEVKQLGIAKLFKGIFDPLRESLQGLAEFLNDPRVFATFQVIGENIGQFIVSAINLARTAIGNLIAAWKALSPETKEAITTFSIAFVAIVALVGAFGLLTSALTILLNPFVVVTALLAGFITDYTQGFTIIRKVTSAFLDFLMPMILAIGRAFNLIPEAVGGAATTTVSILSDLAQDISDWTVSIGNIIAVAFSGLSGLVEAPLMALGGTVEDLLKPASPPKIMPNIDVYGREAMQIYFDAFPEASFDKPASLIRSQIATGIAGPTLRRELRQAGEDNAVAYKDGFWRVLRPEEIFPPGYPNSVKKTSDEEVAPAAYDAGLNVGDAYVNGFKVLLPFLNDVVSEEVTAILAKIGSGPRLSLAGAQAFGGFLEGFKLADFSALNDIAGDISKVLQIQGTIEGLPQEDILAQTFGKREEIAAALAEFRQFGRVSEDTFKEIASGGKLAGLATEDLLRAYFNLVPIQERVEGLQKRLNDVTERYKKIIQPVREELERIQAIRQGLSEDRELKQLQRVVSNLTFSDTRRKEAQAQIDEVLAQRKLRALEKERDVQTGVIQEQLDADEKRQTQAEKDLELVKARFDAQVAQLDLVAQELEIFRKLNEELDKAREKELSLLDRQQKVADLKAAELSDNIKAAKARYTLESDAEATLFDQEKARQDLIQVGLDRQKREEEIVKFGGTADMLKPLRDIAVTLDDIGVKTKESLGGDFDITGDLPNTVELTKQWEKTLGQVRDRFDELKGKILETFNDLNENLPEFLRFKSEKEGGKPPLVDTLEKVALAIGSIVAISTTTKFVGLLKDIAGGFTKIATSLGASPVGGAAAGGFATLGVAGSAGLVALIALFALALLRADDGAKALNSEMEQLNATFGRFKLPEVPKWFEDLLALGTAFGLGGIGKPLGAGGPLVDPEQLDAAGKTRNAFKKFGDELGGELMESLDLSLLPVSQGPIIGGFNATSGTGARLINDMTDFGEFLGDAWRDGFASAVDQSENPLMKSFGELILAIVGAAEDVSEAHSPSQLTKRVIGIPLAEGIAEGFTDSVKLVTDAVAVYTLKFTEFFSATLENMGLFKDDVLEEARLLVEGIGTQIDDLGLVVLPKIQLFHQSATDEFAALNNDIAVISLSMIGNVQTMATVLQGTLSQIASSVTQWTTPNQTQGVPSVVNNVTRSNTFQLNVTSSVPSQGIIGDFTIMRVLAEGAA